MLDRVTQAASLQPDWGKGNAERANTRVLLVLPYLRHHNPNVSGPAREIAGVAVRELAEQIRVKGPDKQGNHQAVLKQWLANPDMVRIINSIDPALIDKFTKIAGAPAAAPIQTPTFGKPSESRVVSNNSTSGGGSQTIRQVVHDVRTGIDNVLGTGAAGRLKDLDAARQQETTIQQHRDQQQAVDRSNEGNQA
jgi:hypothetical protein